MPSLRELLDQQKKGAASNGQNISSAKPSEIKTVDAGKSTTPNNVSENGSGKAEGVVSGNGQVGRQTQPPVLSPGLAARIAEVTSPTPPPGLNPIALMKWKRENPTYVASQTNVVKTVADKPDLVSTTPAQSANAVSQQILPTEIGNKDVGKTNDGVVDTESLRRNLEYLANNIDQKELVKDIVRTIAVQIKENPGLMAHMAHADMDLMVRGLRRSYAIVARKKSEVRENKSAKSAVENELAAAFKDAGLGGAIAGFKLDLS